MIFTVRGKTGATNCLFWFAFERINEPRNPAKWDTDENENDKHDHAVLIQTSENSFSLRHY